MSTFLSHRNKTYFIKIGPKSINIKVLAAFLTCTLLIIIGIVRILSYSKGAFVSRMIEDTFFHHFAYRPENYFNVSFFKIIATPSITALIYLLFRGLNKGGDYNGKHKINNEWRIISFKPLTFRFLLVSMITLCWLPIEVMKFHFENEFYPYSTLENPLLNLIVLTLSGVLCFFLMKYLPFEPLITTKE